MSENATAGVEPAVLGVVKAAAYLDISRRTLERLLDARVIPVVQISPGRRAVKRTDLDAYIARQTGISQSDPAA